MNCKYCDEYMPVMLDGAISTNCLKCGKSINSKHKADLLVLLDNSPSMESWGSKEYLHETYNYLIDCLVDFSIFDLYLFQFTDTFTYLGHQDSPESLRVSVRKLNFISAGTNIQGALEGILKFKQNSGWGKFDIVYLITDGQSAVDENHIVNLYLENGLKIYSIAIGKDSDEKLLRSLSERTFGRFYLFDIFKKDIALTLCAAKTETILSIIGFLSSLIVPIIQYQIRAKREKEYKREPLAKVLVN